MRPMPMAVSPRGQVLAEVPAGAAVDLAETRDTYLRQQRNDVVSITRHG